MRQETSAMRAFAFPWAATFRATHARGRARYGAPEPEIGLPERVAPGGLRDFRYGSIAEILRLLERVSFTPASRPISQLDRSSLQCQLPTFGNLP